MTSRVVAVLVVVGLALGVGFAWHRYGGGNGADDAADSAERDWLTDLHSANPAIASEAQKHLEGLGAAALPEIQEVLRDSSSDPATLKAAMKAAGQLGPVAAPLADDIANHLADPALTADAGVALSYLGREAYGPLRDASRSEDPVVRREALRSLGKLRERAPLEARVLVPRLLDGLKDPDAGVRAVAATYLGIIGEDDAAVVPALIAALKDPSPEVRVAAATALGSFHDSARTIIPALRRATADRDPEVAREAGVAIVKLQGRSGK